MTWVDMAQWGAHAFMLVMVIGLSARCNLLEKLLQDQSEYQWGAIDKIRRFLVLDP